MTLNLQSKDPTSDSKHKDRNFFLAQEIPAGPLLTNERVYVTIVLNEGL